MSRWTMPAAWAWSRASATCRPTRVTPCQYGKPASDNDVPPFRPGGPAEEVPVFGPAPPDVGTPAGRSGPGTPEAEYWPVSSARATSAAGSDPLAVFGAGVSGLCD